MHKKIFLYTLSLQVSESFRYNYINRVFIKKIYAENYINKCNVTKNMPTFCKNETGIIKYGHMQVTLS
jgi:hypothetical protein